MQKRRTLIIFPLLLLLIAVGIPIYWGYQGHLVDVENNQTMTEEEYRFISLWDKFLYGINLRFNFRIFEDGEEFVMQTGGWAMELMSPRSSVFDPFFTDLVFVHNEAEAEAFPYNIIVAWPSWEFNSPENRIASIHWAVNRTEEDLMLRGHQVRPVVTLEEFGLTYPITVADIVDNWEKVSALMNVLTSQEISIISGPDGPPRF